MNAAALLVLVGLTQTPIIEISGANFRPLPLALPQPLADPAARDAAGEFDQTLSFDLEASGLFQLLDRKGFLADAKEGFTSASIQFSRWADVGADVLVKTQLSREGSSLKAELRVFGVSSGKEELKQSLSAGNARALAHATADALWRHYTREPGPFTSRLAFVRPGSTGKQVYSSDWDGRNARAITQGSINLLPTVIPGGGVAYTSYRKGRPDLYLQRPGAEPVSLESQGQMATGIAFSPDGNRIAYSVAAGEGTQLWVANADGSSPQQVTDTPFFINTSPTWSPDGKRLAFVSNRGGSPQIYTLTVGTKDPPKRITFQGNYNQTPDWSPRGDLIAFTARDERNAFDLFHVHVESGKITRLTQDQGNNEEPSFSPNGRLLVFSSNRTGSSQLWVMGLDGSHQVMLPTEKGNFLTPDWGP